MLLINSSWEIPFKTNLTVKSQMNNAWGKTNNIAFSRLYKLSVKQLCFSLEGKWQKKTHQFPPSYLGSNWWWCANKRTFSRWKLWQFIEECERMEKACDTDMQIEDSRVCPANLCHSSINMIIRRRHETLEVVFFFFCYSWLMSSHTIPIYILRFLLLLQPSIRYLALPTLGTRYSHSHNV